MTPLRIAAHNGAPEFGGAEIATARLASGLRRRGHDVLLYCNREEVARRAAELGAPTRRLHLGGDIALHTAVRFAAALRRRPPDVLILGTFRKIWLGALAARLARVPRVVARIGLETDLPRNAKYRWVFRRWIDATVFNAEYVRRRFAEALPEHAARTVTIHTGLPAAAPGDGAAFRARHGIPAGARLIGSVGRLASQKRYDRLAAALPALPGVHAVVVGEGPERPLLEAIAVSHGVADRFHLPGPVEDPADALAAMEVFVLPSDREGLSNAMLEALRAGVPVVSTDVSGAREALGGGSDRGAEGSRAGAGGAGSGSLEVAGVADPPGVITGRSAAELAEVVRALLGNPGRLERMGEAARRVARDRFEEERMLDDWERVLEGAAP